MMKITIQAGTSTYLIASKTIGVDGVGIFQGRLLNEVVLSRRFSKAGNAPVTLNVSIRNNDGFIPRSVNLWAAAVTIVADSGYQWSGKITAYDRDEAGILRLVITEKAAPELTIQFPDEVARLVTVDENFHVSALNVTLPLVAGGNADNPILVKGVLIDKVRGIYLLCVGENRQIVNVYRGTEKLTTGYAAFTGTAGQAEYAGFAYVELTDAELRKNDDGSYVEVSADVIGLKLGSHTVEECRNGARFLQYLLSTPKDGACGWGLGIGSSEIDATAFTEAIARVDAAGMKMDGVFYFRQPAQSWIDQICQAIRGSYEIGENGLRRLFVNADSASAKTYTKKNMKLLRDGKGAFIGQVYNRGRLDFDYNPLTGQFMQHTSFEDTVSIAEIGELEFAGQSYLIRDMATAQAILEYTCKRSLIGADKVYFKTRELPANARTGTIITIDYPEKGLSGTWQIISIDVGSFVHEIEAEKFSSSIFIVGTPGTAIDWAGDAPVVSPVLPGAASGLSLATDVEYDASGDGTAIPYISGTFTLPEGKYLGAAIFWGEGATPSTWENVTIKGTEFKIKPVKAGLQYTVKVQMFNQSGTSAAITGSIVAGSHAAIPPTPTIATATGLGCIVVNIAISAFAALSHFEIQRQKSDGSGLTTVASEYRGTSFTDDDATILADYENLYQYRVRSVSRSGQPSAWTSFTASISATQLRNKDVSADQFIGKHFTTACNVGAGQNGVMFNAQGLQAWCGGVKTVDIPVSGSPTFNGTITAGAGNIGGWGIETAAIYNSGAWGTVSLQAECHSIYTHRPDPNYGEWHGQIFAGGSWTGRYGFAITRSGNYIFRADSAYDGSASCSQIAGWDFTTSSICKDNLCGVANRKIDINSGCASIHYWRGNCESGAFLGQIWTNCWTGRYGLAVINNCVPVFESSYDESGNVINQIAGWNFNATALSKGVAGTCVLLMSGDGVGRHGLEVNSNCLAVSIGRCLHAPDIGYCAMDGILASGAGVGGTLFKIGKYHSDGSTVAQIAGWNFNTTTIYKEQSNGDATNHGIYIAAADGVYCDRIIVFGKSDGANFHTFGGSHFCGDWVHNRWGINIRVNSQNLFTVWSCPDGTCQVAQIAGWDFDNKSLWKSTSACDARLGYPGIYIGTCHDGSAHQGAGFRYIAASTAVPTGDFGVSIGYYLLHPGVTWCQRNGMLIASATNGILFRADTDANGDNVCAQIAGWCFTCNLFKTGTFGCGPSFLMSKENAGSGYFYLGDQILQGYSMIWHHGSNAGHLVIGQIAANASTIKTDYYGLQMMDHGGNEFFALAAKQGYACYELYNRIAGWGFNSHCIWSSSCGLILNSSGTIQTGDFVAGNKGWKIDYVGNAEFNNICARGSIRTAVFIKDQISVVGGCALIRPAGVLFGDATMAVDNTWIFTNDTAQFVLDDIVRIKTESGADYWGYVYAIDTYCGNPFIAVARTSGDYGFTATKGQAIVNYGKANSGGIMLNGQAPYIDLYTHGGSPWNGTCSRLRIGNLNGWGDISTNVYGIALGTPTGNYLRYDSTSSELKLKGVMNIQAGSTMPTSLLNNFSISCNLCQWNNSGSGGWDSRPAVRCDLVKNGVYVAGDTLIASGNAQVLSDWIEIDPTQAYKITLSVWDDGAAGVRYFGMTAIDASGSELMVWPIIPSTGACATAQTNPYFWLGSAANAWRDMEAYILPEGIEAKDVPVGKNVDYHFKIPANTTRILIRYLNYYNAGTQTRAHFYSPSIVPVATEGLNKVYRALSSAGTLISNVAPTLNAAPSGAGLYLGANVMGYYDGGTWKSYMDNSGHFYLSGSTGGLSWDGSLLTVNGTVCSSAGHIGGWCMSDVHLYTPTVSGSWIGLYKNFNNTGVPTMIISGKDDGNTYHTFGGQIYHGGNWINRWGLNLRVAGCDLFSVFASPDGSGQCAQIAGWKFTNSYLCSCGILINSAGEIYSTNYVACSAGWCIGGGGAVDFNNATIRGVITACAGGCISGWTINAASISRSVGSGAIVLESSCGSIYTHRVSPQSGEWHGQIYNSGWTGRYGFAVTRGGSYVFRADTDIDGNAACHQIAGWNFDQEHIYTCSSIGLLGLYACNAGNGIAYPYIWLGSSIGANHITIGGAHYSGGWTVGKNGIQIVSGSTAVFTAYACCDGTGGCFNFAGWEFNSNYLSKHNSTVAKDAWTWLSACESLPAATYSATFAPMGTGVAVHKFGAYAGFVMLGKLPALSGYSITGASNLYGLLGNYAGADYFKLAFDDDNGAICANIAGWNFNSACLYSGNLIMNSSGAISGCYSGDSTGWCIDAAGNAKFNNATVKGTVYASAGCFGCFSISGGALHASSGSTFSNIVLCSAPECSYWTPVAIYFDDGGIYRKNGHISADSVGMSRLGPTHCHYSALNAFGCLRLYTCTIAGAMANTCILLDSYADGATASASAILVCTYGGTSCFAFCTNGRIQVQGTVYPSDRNLKTDFEIVSVLPMLRNAPVMKWRYKGSRDYQFGPMSQDFNPAFKLVHDWETNLTVSNLDGIALRGVQELDECVAYNNRRILELESRNACLETRLNCIESELMRLKLAA